MTFSEASMLLIIRECSRPSLIWLQANPRCLAFLPPRLCTNVRLRSYPTSNQGAEI